MALLCVALFPISCNTHKYSTALQDDVNESKIFYEPEQQPFYLNGGGQGLLNDLYTTMLKTGSISNDSITGRAVVTFYITEIGKIDPNSIMVFKNWSVPDDYTSKAIEAIKHLGKFEPGKMYRTPMKVRYFLPIIYPIPLEYIKSE